MRARESGVLLAGQTSFRIGGTAREFHSPQTLEEFRQLLARLAGRDPFLLGGGCNTLFSDGTFERPVISTRRLRSIEVNGATLRAEAGVRNGTLLQTAMGAGLGGLEFLVGIPGTVGGATVMNAGGGASSFGELVGELGLVDRDGREERVAGKELAWGYRSWNLAGYSVAWVVLRLTREPPARLRERAAELFRRKSRSQPLMVPSAGCIFRNPPGNSAGALIDRAGLKGSRCGGAMVSDQHANFIVNREGRASAADVRRLIETVRDRVAREFRVRLDTEVVLA